jgi:hypothetical protein
LKKIEASTQTGGGQKPVLDSKSVSTQSDDWQELTFVVNSYDKEHQNHKSTENILFANDIVQTKSLVQNQNLRSEFFISCKYLT